VLQLKISFSNEIIKTFIAILEISGIITVSIFFDLVHMHKALRICRCIPIGVWFDCFVIWYINRFFRRLANAVPGL